MGNDQDTFADLDLDAGAAAAAAPERFRIDDEIARGGLGKVSRGRDLALDREVAIKELLTDSQAARARFDRETRITARLQHPNIVAVYDGGTDDRGHPYLAMRLVHGRSLSEAIAEADGLEGRLTLLPHVIAACNAVAYAHSESICHRDLKPDNILVGDFGETVVIDWGLAKDLTVEAEEEPGAFGWISGASGASLTRVGAVMGTPAYMPPEQATGAEVDTRADVYALGAVLYEILTSKRPYDGSPDTLAAVVAGPPQPAGALTEGIPPDLAAVVTKAMGRTPDQRYPSAMELASELEHFESGRWVTAYHYSPTERFRHLVRRHPVPFGLTALLAFTILAALIGLTRANGVAHDRAEALAQLRAEETVRFDARTLEQARLVTPTDPGRALRLLTELSDGHSFGGEVHTVVAAAISAQPSHNLQLPEGALPDKVSAGPGGVLVALEREVVHFDSDLVSRGVTDLGADVAAVAQGPAGSFACTLSHLFELTQGRAPTPLTGPCNSLHAVPDGVLVVSSQGTIDHHTSQSTVRLAALDEPTRVLVDGHLLWAVGAGVVRVFDLEQGRWIAERQAPAHIAAYGMQTHQNHLMVLHQGPTLLLLSLVDGELQMATPSLHTRWAVTADFLDDDHLVLGGDAEHVEIWNRNTQELTTVETRGRPYHIVRQEEGVAVVTDAGQLALLRIEGNAATLRELGSPNEPLLRILNGPGGRLILQGRSQLATQHAREQDGVTVLQAAPGTTLRRASTVLAIGPSGATSVTQDPLVQLSELPTLAAMRCAGREWLAHPGVLVQDRGVTLPVDGYATHLTCSIDGTFAAAVLHTGLAFTFDPQTGEHGDPTFLQGLSADQQPQAEASSGGIHVFGGKTWTLPALGSSPVLESEPAGFGSSGTAMGDVLYIGTRLGSILTADGTSVASMGGLVTRMASVDDQLFAGDYYGGLMRLQPGRDPEQVVGHSQYINHLSPHPQGRWLASTSWDHETWIWDTTTTPLLGRPLPPQTAPMVSAEWSSNGRHLYTVDQHGTVKRWNHEVPADPAELRAYLRTQVERLGPR